MLIEKVINAVNYVVRRSRRAQPLIVHVDKMKRCLEVSPPSWLEKDQSVLNDRDSNNADLLGAECVQPTNGPVLTGTDTSTPPQNRPIADTTCTTTPVQTGTDTSSPERNRPSAGTMPVLTGEPTDGGLMGVATTTPLDDWSGTAMDMTTDADTIPVRRNPRRQRRRPRRFC